MESQENGVGGTVAAIHNCRVLDRRITGSLTSSRRALPWQGSTSEKDTYKWVRYQGETWPNKVWNEVPTFVGAAFVAVLVAVFLGVVFPPSTLPPVSFLTAFLTGRFFVSTPISIKMSPKDPPSMERAEASKLSPFVAFLAAEAATFCKEVIE